MSGSACPAFPARAFCRGRFICGLHLLGVGPGQQRSRGQCSHTHVGPEPSRAHEANDSCLLYTSPSPRDLSTSRMPSSA